MAQYIVRISKSRYCDRTTVWETGLSGVKHTTTGVGPKYKLCICICIYGCDAVTMAGGVEPPRTLLSCVLTLLAGRLQKDRQGQQQDNTLTKLTDYIT